MKYRKSEPIRCVFGSHSEQLIPARFLHKSAETKMVVLISSTVNICRVKPKLKDASFSVNWFIPRPEVQFFSGNFLSSLSKLVFGDVILRKGLNFFNRVE